jgi:hypothetical protein
MKNMQTSIFDITDNYHGGNGYSILANESIREAKVRLRNMVVAYVAEQTNTVQPAMRSSKD